MKENLDARLEKDFTNIEENLFYCKMYVNPNIAYQKYAAILIFCKGFENVFTCKKYQILFNAGPSKGLEY